MVEVTKYSYLKPSNFKKDQLITEIWDALSLWPQTFEYDDINVIIGFRSPLTSQQQSELASTVSNHVADEYFEEKQNPWTYDSCLIFFAKIHSLDMDNNKLTVKVTIGEQNFTKECLVTSNLKHMFTTDGLSENDKVMVTFIDRDTTKPIVFDKVLT